MCSKEENFDCGPIKTREVTSEMSQRSRSSDCLKNSSNIFKLNSDCLDIVFDYLSLKDLHSFGLTCKMMQRIAGEYFLRVYKSSEKFSGNDGIYTVSCDNNDVLGERVQTSGFNRYINYISHYYEHLEPLTYIQRRSEELQSIKHLYLVCLKINMEKMAYLQKILPKMEILQMRQCTVDGDIYDTLLKYCCNLKQIYVQDDLGYILDENANPWLLQDYPMLQHLQLTPRYSFKIHELRTFFERNRNLQSFSTSSRCLWENRHDLMDSCIQLDKLEILILDNYHRHLINMQSICRLLNEFFERGFYKRLYLYVKRVDLQSSEHLTTLDALEMISIRQFSETYNLSSLINLKELEINDGINSANIEILATKLVNLERLSLKNVTASQILPFIRHSMQLYRIHVHLKDNTLNLIQLNDERVKLIGARKIVIYVPNNTFLATIWTCNGIINLNCIEMRRMSQF